MTCTFQIIYRETERESKMKVKDQFVRFMGLTVFFFGILKALISWSALLFATQKQEEHCCTNARKETLLQKQLLELLW